MTRVRDRRIIFLRISFLSVEIGSLRRKRTMNVWWIVGNRVLLIIIRSSCNKFSYFVSIRYKVNISTKNSCAKQKLNEITQDNTHFDAFGFWVDYRPLLSAGFEYATRPFLRSVIRATSDFPSFSCNTSKNQNIGKSRSRPPLSTFVANWSSALSAADLSGDERSGCPPMTLSSRLHNLLIIAVINWYLNASINKLSTTVGSVIHVCCIHL